MEAVVVPELQCEERRRGTARGALRGVQDMAAGSLRGVWEGEHVFSLKLARAELPMPTETQCCSSSTAETVGTKFHTSLNVSDLARSIAFYRLLLGLEPAKQRHDYAKFELEDPPLVLTLMPGRPAAGGILNHFGLRVADSETLVEMQHRLE